MVNKTLIASIFIGLSLIAIFLIWHFLLSIYEVKFIAKPEVVNLKQNQKFQIEAVALNSIGWEIRFRDLECEYQIVEGIELVEIKKSKNNFFDILAKDIGEIKILANSKYSLNASFIKINVIK